MTCQTELVPVVYRTAVILPVFALSGVNRRLLTLFVDSMNPYEAPIATQSFSNGSRASRFAGVVVYGIFGYVMPLLIVVALSFSRLGGSIADFWSSIIAWHSPSLGMLMLVPSILAMTMFGIAGYDGLLFWTEKASFKRAALLGILVLIAVAIYGVVLFYTSWMNWQRSQLVDALIYPAFVGSVPLVAHIAMVVQKLRTKKATNHAMDRSRG